MGTLINYSTEQGIATIELCNLPANAYSYEMFKEMDAAILDARMNNDVHVILLRGAGDKFFCAGADINMLNDADPTFKYYFCLHANETLSRLEATPKLVIAAIGGHCVGGGLEVALAADIRVAKAGSYKLGLPEVALGVLPGTGGTQRLTRAIGGAKALELMATGRLFDVNEASDLGLVNKVIDEADFWAGVTEYARSFCPPNRASQAVGLIKRAVVSGGELPLQAGLAVERELQQRLFCADDAKEGLAAHVDKRKPDFSGR